jgi:hypothetical protein
MPSKATVCGYLYLSVWNHFIALIGKRQSPVRLRAEQNRREQWIDRPVGLRQPEIIVSGGRSRGSFGESSVVLRA